MDLQHAIQILRERPGAVGVDGSFGQATAFLAGADAGSDGALLIGFREWLVVRAGVGNNLTWRGLVLNLSRPEEASGVAPVDEDSRLVQVLLDLLSDFHEVRSDADGLLHIYDWYIKWLRRQDWYSPSSPAYLDHPE
jgi:hypothetical protein